MLMLVVVGALDLLMHGKQLLLEREVRWRSTRVGRWEARVFAAV